MKRKKIIVILLIICLIILMILGITYYNAKKEKEQTGKPLTPLVDPKEDDVLNISGFGIFFEKYSGNLKSSEIAEHLDMITTTYLPEMFNQVKEYDTQQINEYYSNNADDIKDNLGIENVENFTSFLQKLKNLNEDLNSWYRLDLIKDTFTDESDKEDYAYVEYEVSLKNDNKLKFSLYISKSVTTKPTYIIDVID